MKLFYSYDIGIEKAYIITLKGNKISENHSKICQESCKNIGQDYVVWDAFDGTGKEIIVPDHSINESIINMVKVTNHFLVKSEVACLLSHLSLWVHCVKLDKPIIILEHDAIMIKKLIQLESFNSIVYLGGIEWAKQNWNIHPIPPHASRGPNYHCICRAHAYAIDPQVAKNLIAQIIQLGIHTTADLMLRADVFNITHQGLHAYDNSIPGGNDTTITGRPDVHDWNKAIYNPDLSQ